MSVVAVVAVAVVLGRRRAHHPRRERRGLLVRPC